jgi:hypothetical protein
MSATGQDDLDKLVRDHAARVETTVRLSNRILLISEDALELQLKAGTERLSAQTAWAVPLGIVISCLLTIVTSSFHDFLKITAAVWQAVFIIVGCSSFVWLVNSLCHRRNFSSQDFLELIRGVASPFTTPDVSQSDAPSPLDSIQRGEKEEENQAAWGIGERQTGVAATARISDPFREIVTPLQTFPFRGAQPISEVLQCRSCGAQRLAVKGQHSICPNCKMFS